jgi:hypothetical protein
MKSLPGLAVSRSSGIRERASYEDVAAEYYDERRHPTCADFREASRWYLKRVFELERPNGRLADIGCGLSLISEFTSDNLVLIDEARAMLEMNSHHPEKRKVNIVEMPFGSSEFDWIFAILADPYNEIGAWANIAKGLKQRGECVFMVPSFCWASKFRTSSKNELPGKARFDLFSGASLFLPSNILLPEDQEVLISAAGLESYRLDHVHVGDLAKIRSAKISSVLSDDDALLDVYRVRKP